MKAVVFYGIGDIRLEDVSEPKIRLTASAICGTDLHFVRGTIPGMKPGHEGVGGWLRRWDGFLPGDRVVIRARMDQSGTGNQRSR